LLPEILRHAGVTSAAAYMRFFWIRSRFTR